MMPKIPRVEKSENICPGLKIDIRSVVDAKLRVIRNPIKNVSINSLHLMGKPFNVMPISVPMNVGRIDKHKIIKSAEKRLKISCDLVKGVESKISIVFFSISTATIRLARIAESMP
jgi:hypothetical protein